MGRFSSYRPAPSDAAPLMALLARDELRRVDEERERLMKVIASIAPRHSTILEGALKKLTKRRVQLVAAIGSAGR